MELEHATLPGEARDLGDEAGLASGRGQDSKPRFRGVPDLIATLIIVPASGILVGTAHSGVATTAATVYTLGLTFLFAMSTTYHFPTWPPAARPWLRRGDHAAIFVLIAASYTPPCLLLLSPAHGVPLLAVVWIFAALGFAKTMLWTTSPRWLNTSLYLLMGWLVLPFSSELWASGGGFFIAMVLGGGLLFSIGAVIYAKRLFNRHAAVFGYHEVFHLFVIAASACHFVAMWNILV